MSAGIDTEAVHSHFYKVGVAVNQIVVSRRIFRIEIHAVAGNLSPPACFVVPVEVSEMVPQVVHIMVLSVGVFHFPKPRSILLA